MVNSKYFEILNSILKIQIKILDTVKKGEVVPVEYFEERNKLAAKFNIINTTDTKDTLKLKEEISLLEKKILKEAKKQFDISKLNILKHQKSVSNMMNYFKAQIKSNSEIDINI